MPTPQIPVLLLQAEEDDDAVISLLRTPADRTLAAAARKTFKETIDGLPSLTLERPDQPWDNTYFWIEDLAATLNQTCPLPHGTTGIALAYEPDSDIWFSGISKDPFQSLLRKLGEPQILDLALRVFMPGCHADLGGSDHISAGAHHIAIVDGASYPILVDLTKRNGAQSHHFCCPVIYSDKDEAGMESEFASLIADRSSPGGWVVIPVMAWHEADFPLDKHDRRELSSQLDDSEALATWVKDFFWKNASLLDDPIVGHHHLAEFGYLSRNVPDGDSRTYRILGGTLEDYNAHVEALLAIAPENPKARKLCIRAGLAADRLAPSIVNAGPLTRGQRKVLGMIIAHFLPDGMWPTQFTTNRFSAFSRRCYEVTFSREALSGHDLFACYDLLKAFLIARGKSDDAAAKLLQ